MGGARPGTALRRGHSGLDVAHELCAKRHRIARCQPRILLRAMPEGQLQDAAALARAAADEGPRLRQKAVSPRAFATANHLWRPRSPGGTVRKRQLKARR